jgi:hypothetical protein
MKITTNSAISLFVGFASIVFFTASGVNAQNAAEPGAASASSTTTSTAKSRAANKPATTSKARAKASKRSGRSS